MFGRLLVNFNFDSLYCFVRVGFPCCRRAHRQVHGIGRPNLSRGVEVEKHPLPEADLLLFRGKIEGKSHSRGLHRA